MNASEPTIRKIHFPEERSVGSFRLIPGVNKWREYLLSDPVVFDAKGEVVVDDETSLLLTVNEESVDDLSGWISLARETSNRLTSAVVELTTFNYVTWQV